MAKSADRFRDSPRGDEEKNAGTPFQFWNLVISLSLIAVALEWLRVDPTFGTSVSVWLFFPLLAVVWRGFWAGVLTALIASLSLLFISRAIYLPFDALIFVGTTAIVGWCCREGNSSRVIDGVLLSWLVCVPASVLFHLETYRLGVNAGILITTTMLLSQLVPAMLVQWLGFIREPLRILKPFFGPQRANGPVHILIVVRAALIPMILLPVLIVQYFSLTQSLLARAELEEQRATLLGQALTNDLRLLLEPPSGVSGIEKRSDALFLTEIEQSLAQSRENLPSGILPFELELIERASEVDTVQTYIDADAAFVVRSPIDWVMHRQLVFDIALTPTASFNQNLRVIVPFATEYLGNQQFKIWGLLVALVFLVLLEGLYRLAILRLIKGFDSFGSEIAAWAPGQGLEVMNHGYRGRILQVDQYVDGINKLVREFNDNYRVLSESSEERLRLFARVSAILSSIAEPMIVTDEKLVPLSGFSNVPGRQWGRHLTASLQKARELLEGSLQSRGDEVTHGDAFVDAIVAALRGDGSVLNRNLTLKDSDGNNHEFRLSVGVVPKGTERPGSDQEMKAIGGFVFLLTDISLLLNRQWEQGRRTRLASLENIAVGVAHELNQPLNTIRMVTHNLIRLAQKDGLDSFMIAAKLTRIDEQVDRMAGLISTMRAFSSGDTSNQRPLDPCVLLRNVVTLQRGNLRAEHIELRYADEELDCQVVANNNALGHVFAEIIENAMEALSTSDNEPRWLSVTTAIDGDNWQACFTDNGGGIPEDVLDRIFEPFFTTKEQAQHSGSGLHEAYRIMGDLGGALTASNTDQGACFVVQVPLATEDEAAS